ncbi:hypothetical protein EK904_004486, partial [Melospiza melodia maxima]
AATAALNKKSSSHLTALCLCAELCCCSWQAVGAQGHTGALQEELTHIQPQTGAVNLLPACRDCAETKGSAWDTATLGCWSTDGVEVLSVKREYGHNPEMVGIRTCVDIDEGKVRKDRRQRGQHDLLWEYAALR